ncbi:MAG: hypothetical protein QOE29_2257, partial [Gaiellaceae bacterium]|nr:hypothetical protein [Gaiellaceae bacterium]
MTRNHSELTAIVVNWNKPDLTIRAVEALVADGIPPARIVVVDNASPDDSWERIRGSLAASVLVRTSENVGFGRANNLAARVLPGTSYLLVNNDAFVHRPGSVAALVAALEDERVGIAVPRLLNEDLSLQRSIAPFTTPTVALVRASGLSRVVPNRWQPRLGTHWDHAASRSVEVAVGAVELVRGALWDALGGFRETSFMFAEDLDLCWRTHELGWKTWFVADAEFIHLHRASSRTVWDEATRNERIGRAEAGMLREHLSPARAA